MIHMVDETYVSREIQSLLDGIMNNLGFIGSPKKEVIAGLVQQIRDALEGTKQVEILNPDEIARVTWVLEDVVGAIARRYGDEQAARRIPRDEIEEIGAAIGRQLEDDCTERGWDSIDTQLRALVKPDEQPTQKGQPPPRHNHAPGISWDIIESDFDRCDRVGNVNDA